MTTLGFITIGAVGFVLGLYVSSQIMEHIDTRTRHKKFLRDMDKYDSGRSENDPVSVWNKHKRK